MAFDAAIVRFGKPGVLYVATLGTTEPTTVSSAWPAGWVQLGYTTDGSTFNYSTTVDPVNVAEEILPIAYAPSGGTASLEFATAETTKLAWSAACNAGLPAAGDGQNWTFEPPVFGNEVRVMFGWDASRTVATNDLRFIWRKAIQGGTASVGNKKGATIASLSQTWNLEQPAGSARLFKILGSGIYNPVPTGSS
jgi:hypothetical protein